jgi:hypothetical protein
VSRERTSGGEALCFGCQGQVDHGDPPGVARPLSKRRRLAILLALAFAVTLGVVSMAAPIGATDSKASATVLREMRYVDPLTWSFTYPSTMHLERSHAFLRISVAEVTVASFRMRAAVHSRETSSGGSLRVDPPRDRTGAFPADGVAFRISHREGGPAPDVWMPESRFPLRLSTFRRPRDYPSSRPIPVARVVVANGRDYYAEAWIGPKASRSRRATLAAVVSSLSFPRLHLGQTVGYGFHVLRPSAQYPVGSFTRVRVGRRPFYLVHAPGGFYAIGWTWESITGGYKARCVLQLDRSRHEFLCTNMKARWDRVGRVLVKPHGASRGDPLNITVCEGGLGRPCSSVSRRGPLRRRRLRASVVGRIPEALRRRDPTNRRHTPRNAVDKT